MYCTCAYLVLLHRSCLETKGTALPSECQFPCRHRQADRKSFGCRLLCKYSSCTVCRSWRRMLRRRTSLISLTGSLERPLPRLGKQCPFRVCCESVMSASLAVPYHPAASRCCPRTPVPSRVVCESVLAESARVPACWCGLARLAAAETAESTRGL